MSILGHSKVPGIGSTLARARRRVSTRGFSVSATSQSPMATNMIMNMTRNASSSPTGLFHSKAPCHSLTVRQDSACLEMLISKVWVRFVRWKGLKISIARNAVTPAPAVCSIPRQPIVANTFFEGIVMKWIAAKTTSIMNAYTYPPCTLHQKTISGTISQMYRTFFQVVNARISR